MKRIFYGLTILSFPILSLLLNSCKKETPDTETQSSVDNAICENEFNSRIQLVNFLAMNSYKIKSVQTSGPTVTTDTINRVITIDYGSAGITDTMDGDSRMRKGMIIATFDSLWHKTNATATVQLINYAVSNDGGASFLDYSADNITIKRSDSITFNYSITGGKCIGTNYSLQWSTNRVVKQTGGYLTVPNVSDDVYSSSIGGTSSGVDRNGKSYSTVISSSIVKGTNCKWIASGTLELTPSGLSSRTIIYGTGTCDNKASLIINGNTFTFTMN